MISESLLQRATASDGRILRDRVLSGFMGLVDQGRANASALMASRAHSKRASP